jgi:plastocyanin
MLQRTAPKTTLAGALVLPALVLLLSGCTGSQPSQMLPSEGASQDQPAASGATDGDIVTVGLEYMPADLTVEAGTTVRWVNGEAVSHTITSGSWGGVNESTGLRGTQVADGRFDHALAPKGQEGDTFAFTFDQPGEYQFFCRPHLGMSGTITVD